MFNNKKVIAIIPARSGSVGIPGKNIKLLNGKPLIHYAIDRCKRCKYIDKIVVSTDCPEISNIALQYGAEIPFLRPKELATNQAKSIDVVVHMINNTSDDYQWIVLTQPTSPFCTSDHLDQAFEAINTHKTDSLISFKKATSNPYWMVQKSGNHSYAPLFENSVYQRQSLPEFYEYNGAIYIANRSNILKNLSFENSNTFLFEMDNKSSIDLDTIDDWNYAEWISS